MRRFTEIQDSMAQNQSKPNNEKNKEVETKSIGRGDITISDNEGNILYEKGKTYDITPDQIKTLEEASGLLPGEVIEGLPLAAGLGHTRSRMSEKDLQHFEQMLPALQGQQSRQPSQMAVTSKGKQGLER